MININCDVGEGVGNEHLLMPYISSCNIACGGHAGDISTMNQVIDLANQHNVKIGAHPSYPDRENFGRTSMALSSNALFDSINEQIQLLESIAHQHNSIVTHIKPHGALYNDLAKDTLLANNFLDAIDSYKVQYSLYAPHGSTIAKIAQQRDFSIVYEAFADRNYNENLSLVSRQEPDAVLTDANAITEHVLRIQRGAVKTITNKLIAIKADTYCVHSDTKNAINIVKHLHEVFANI